MMRFPGLPFTVSSSSRRPSGQAVLEMLLIIMLAVAIILGLIFRFNESLGKYATNVFGEYLSCMIELGELPGSAAVESCREAFKFSGSGTSPGGGPGGGSDGGPGAGDGDGDGDDSPTNTRPSRDSDAGGGGGAGGAGRSGAVGSEARDDASARFVSNRSRLRRTGRSGTTGRGLRNEESGDLGVYENPGARMERRTNVVAGDEDRFVSRRRKKVKDKEETPPKRTAQVTTQDSSTPMARIRVKKPDSRAVASSTSEDVEWAFGDILRWFLIIAIILALLIFLGGQLLQLTKSMDD